MFYNDNMVKNFNLHNFLVNRLSQYIISAFFESICIFSKSHATQDLLNRQPNREANYKSPHIVSIKSSTKSSTLSERIIKASTFTNGFNNLKFY